MINGNEKEPGNENRSHWYDINRLRPRHGNKCYKYKMYLKMKMITFIKQHLSSIWSSTFEARMKKALLIKNMLYLPSVKTFETLTIQK